MDFPYSFGLENIWPPVIGHKCARLFKKQGFYSIILEALLFLCQQASTWTIVFRNYTLLEFQGQWKLPLHSSADTGKHDMYIMSNCNCNVGEGSVD